MKIIASNFLCWACLSITICHSANAKVTIRSLEQAIDRAIAIDPWQNANGFNHKAVVAQSKSVNTLPDPKISVGWVNVPTDGFALDQEPMTQARVGVSQSFNRGQSAELKQQQLQALSRQFPYLSDDRKASVSAKVSQLWLEGHQAQLSLNMLENDRGLFEQLALTVESQYSSAQGVTRQDDVIRAKLEVSRLQNRLVGLKGERDEAIARLDLWLMDDMDFQNIDVRFPDTLLDIKLPQALAQTSTYDSRALSQVILRHPAVEALKQQIIASKHSINIARQSYKPKWAVNASYGHRQSDQIGQSRADFLSIGVTFDMPIFGKKQQDNNLQSAKYQYASKETGKRLLVRQMVSQLSALISNHSRLVERYDGYQQRILPQLQQQAEASLNAYTNDNKPFSEVMQAKISELNGRLAMIDLKIQIYKVRKHLHYYLGHVEKEQQPLDSKIMEAR